MILRPKQSKFIEALSLLISFAITKGYELTFADGHCKPCPDCGYYNHLKTGKHPKGLAQDINLFKDGTYLDKTEDHQELGEYWESIGGIWGGRFKKQDGNHYEWPD